MLQPQCAVAQRHTRKSSKHRQAKFGSWSSRPSQPRVRFDGRAAKPTERQRAWNWRVCCRTSTERTHLERQGATCSSHLHSKQRWKKQDVRRRLSSAREHDFASVRWPSHAHGKQWRADGLHAGVEERQRLLQSKGAAVASASSIPPTLGWKRPVRVRFRRNLWRCAIFMGDISRI